MTPIFHSHPTKECKLSFFLFNPFKFLLFLNTQQIKVHREYLPKLLKQLRVKIFVILLLLLSGFLHF